MTPEDIARVVHEAIRAYNYTLDDATMPAWDDSPDHLRVGLIRGVTFLWHNPNVKPNNLHDEWVRRMLADGWKQSTVKDPGARLHTLLIPWHELPVEEQMGYALFYAVALAFFSTVPVIGAQGALITDG